MEGKRVVKTVFIALVLDLLAFTMPLPLFPRLTAWYTARESGDPNTLLSQLLGLSNRWRSILVGYAGQSEGSGKNWDVVLLGGAMGSLFSFCQCLISPSLGALSDRYGRKKVLLATMSGNILSAAVWLRSTTFASFLLSRLIGGLSEGNVQLSTAIIGDVTTDESRSKSLALIGIAFSVCFTLGPSLGAYFASRPPLALTGSPEQLNIYALPAAITLSLLIIETTYLAFNLPETKSWSKRNASGPGAASPSAHVLSAQARRQRLRVIGTLHGAFLLLFSGAEFTLTFLTYDLFASTNAENGRLLSFIGTLSASLQARHVRPQLAKLGELNVSRRGVLACATGLALLACLPIEAIRQGAWSTLVLYSAASCLAYTSATVVTGLTAAAAACCEGDGGAETDLKRGRAMGSFRSKGQLGRAVGPILTASGYWLIGPIMCYGLTAACMTALWVLMRPYASAPVHVHRQKSQ